MGEILDNQTVTTDMLNNIAIDLGATTFSKFSGEKFGVDTLNDITKALAGKGVTQGANKCKPYFSGNDLYIDSGTIIFATGAKIRIASPLKLTKQNGSYVYALNSTDTNTAEIAVSESLPTTGDFVKLASVDTSGSLTDLREWSQSEVLLTKGRSVTKTIENLETASAQISINVGWTGWTILAWNPTRYSNYKSWSEIKENTETTCYSFEDVSRIGTLGFKIIRNGESVNITLIKSSGVGGDLEFTFV